MVSFTLFKSASLLALFSTLVSAAPADKSCSGFRVTSPHNYFSITAGQCYQVSYDFGGYTPTKGSWISVDLYEYETDKLIKNLVNKNIAGDLATHFFNVDLGSYQKTGNYYFLVTYGPSCTPIKTSYFQVTYNKNSPPAVCPK